MKTLIDTKYGSVQGIRKDGVIQFLGIPFAKAPVGDLAFRKPVETDGWKGVLDASKGSANPVQHIGHTGFPNLSQDCLYLNIFVPETDKNNLPVMVWIFGGSYAEGGAGAQEKDGNELIYNPSKIARENEVIVVTFNYRLNLYGFVNLHFLSDRFDVSCGLYDQIFALKFVRETIACFGGNQDNVTLFGQSAGAACILALMSMEEADSYFHKAICMSPCVEHFFTEEESRRNTREYLKILKIKETELEKIFDLTMDQVDEANKKFARKVMFGHIDVRCAFSPAIDGTVLKDQPKVLCQKCTKPILITGVQEEANPFTLPLPSAVLWIMSKFLHLKIEKNSKRDFKHRVSDAVSDYIYVKPAQEILAGYKGPKQYYRYTYVTPDSRENGMGAYHFSDVPVLMGYSTRHQNVDDEESQEEGRKLRKMFADFAKN